MRLSQCFNGPHRALPTLPCPLSEFPFICFLLRVASRVVHLFVVFLFNSVRIVVSSLLRCVQWLSTRACLD